MHGTPPRHPNADGADLAGTVSLGIQPHARVAAEAAGAGQAQIAQDVNDELLDAVNVAGRGVAAHGHRQDRVADELARSVIGDIAAPVAGYQLGADRGRVHEDVLGPRPHAEGVDVGMLQEEQPVIQPRGPQAALEGQAVLVAHPTQPARPQGPTVTARLPSPGSR